MKLKMFGFDHHKNSSPWDEAPPWAVELAVMLALLIEQGTITMSIVDDIKAAQAITDQKITAISADVQTLLAKITAVPTGDLPPDVVIALQDIKDHADSINNSLSAIDTAATGTAPAATPPAA